MLSTSNLELNCLAISTMVFAIVVGFKRPTTCYFCPFPLGLMVLWMVALFQIFKMVRASFLRPMVLILRIAVVDFISVTLF